MRVAIFVTNAPGNYGGGRLAAYVLAQCLARAGADVAFVDAEAGTVGQVHWFTAQRQNDVFDVIQVTGSYAGARRETDYATIDRIVDSIRINP